jgi:inner membrane protein
MNFRLLLKVGAVFLVSLLLVIPISQVSDLVQERQNLRDQVVADIARSAGYAQTVLGPFLVVPYEHTTRSWTEETKDKPRQLVEQQTAGEFIYLPKRLNLSGDVVLNERARGIYKVRVFNLGADMRGEFEVEPHYGVKEGLEDYTFGAPYLVLGVSDIRGITGALSLRWDNGNIAFEPSTVPAGSVRGPVLPTVLSTGVHAVLPPLTNDSQAQVVEFGVDLGLQGTGELRVLPVGRDTRVQLTSNWPHPSFVGEFLPAEHTISAAGFDATWQTSFFATNMEALVARCHGAANPEGVCPELSGKAFAVSFVDPIDHYLKSERATKYAFLFVGLTFALFFLFEVLRRFSVHPIQYGLVGLALAVFFLSLLSLSEHLGFTLAYFAAATASVLLISYYVVPILGSAALASVFGGTLALLYGVLYGILSSEDYALLTGSVVVFCVLGAVMLATRRVNWAKFGQTPNEVPPNSSEQMKAAAPIG